MRTGLVYTDCMAIGDAVEENERYFSLLVNKYPQIEWHIIAESGTTTGDSLSFLDRASSYKPDLVIYGFGVNNALPRGLLRKNRGMIIRKMYQLRFNESVRLLLRTIFLNPLEYVMQIIRGPKFYETKLETLDDIRTCYKRLTVVDCKFIVLNIAPVLNYRFINACRYIKDYNSAIETLRSELNIEIVDVFELFNKEGIIDCLSDDKFHYSKLGHRLVFDELENIIETKLKPEEGFK